MSNFPNAQGFQVSGGQFIASTTSIIAMPTNAYQNGPTGIDILREASAPEAAHDSSARSYSPRCFPGTREQYIEDIVGQATPSLGNNPLPIYWMKGPAGVGKSAIAQTCAERLKKKGALGASFFFSVSGQCKAEKLFPSIAYQLSTVHPAYCDLVDQRIRRDTTLADKALRFQFQYLIDEPLRELEESGRGIGNEVQIIIDGLDECKGTDAQCEIIRIIAVAASEDVLPLRWNLFSRPEPHIETTFSRANISPHCYKTTLPFSKGANGEIELYLGTAFNNILPPGDASTRNPWPSAEDMKTLVGAADGSFIYAASIVRYVGHRDSLSPQKRLIAILSAILERRCHPDSSTAAPFAELDAFYTLILRHIPTRILPSVHLLLALLCRFGSLGSILAANLLGMSKDEFHNVCHHISAVVQFKEPGKELKLDPTVDTSRSHTQADKGLQETIYGQIQLALGGSVGFYHKSFFDFLLDPTRSGVYTIKASKALAKQLLKVDLKYGRSFCWRGLGLVTDVPDSAAPLSYPYTNELVNSALKAMVYVRAGNEDPDSFPAAQEARGPDANRDFRKWLHMRTTFMTANHMFSFQRWGCQSQGKYFQGVEIRYIPHNKFPKAMIAEFKLMIKWREQAGIIQQYHPNLISKIKCHLHNNSREGVESALYRMGRGDRSIFWYWEIHHKLGYYREFRSIDLTEGKKIFREQDFDSWPKYSKRNLG